MDDGVSDGAPCPRDPAEEERRLEIQRAADRVCALILYSDLPLIDIRISAAEVRRLCDRYFPERAGLYRRLYESRFRRLWAQWRGGDVWP